jgi:hypothetical protein
MTGDSIGCRCLAAVGSADIVGAASARYCCCCYNVVVADIVADTGVCCSEEDAKKDDLETPSNHRRHRQDHNSHAVPQQLVCATCSLGPGSFQRA